MTRVGSGLTIPCPSSLHIARWEAGCADTAQEHQQTKAHLQECLHCTAIASDIRTARSDLFSNSSNNAAIAARRIVALSAKRRQERRRRWFHFLPLTAAPILAGAAALLLVVPKFTRAPETARILAKTMDKGVRAKGGLVMEAYCKRKDAVFPVNDGATFFAGDRLRFAYTVPVAGYLMIFGVNDDGQIFPYYSDGRLVGIPVAAGARHVLPGSVELDAHRGLERVFALWSDKPIGGEPVRKAVAGALATLGDIGRVAELEVPADQVSYLLRRP